ncbi:MAG: hypothetical protein GX927_03010 [Lentisphaerae bacterium]|mgnify:FL=1|jgi:hypothetical protein|nr:hypothetical protein [Lentisphaerota bacterium]
MLKRVAMGLVVSLAFVHAQNVLKNPSFELVQEQYTNLPESWSTLVPSGAVLELDNTLSVDGSNSLKIVNPNKGKVNPPATWIQHHLEEQLKPLIPSDKVEFSAYFRAVNAPCKGSFFFESSTAKKCHIRNITAEPGEWRKIELIFPLETRDYSKAHVAFRAEGAGTLLIDGAYLGPVGQNPFKPEPTEAELAALDHCRLVELPCNARFASGKAPQAVTLSAILPQSELTIILSDVGGKVIREWKRTGLPVRKNTVIPLQLPLLPDGAYEMKFTSGSLTDYDWFRIGDFGDRGADFDERGYLRNQGETIFPIGICTPSGEMDALRVYSQSGINLITSQLPLFPAMADYMHEITNKFGLRWMLWNSWGFSRLSESETVDLLLKSREMLRKDPGFLGFLADEPAVWALPVDNFRFYYKQMLRCMPEYLAWINHAPRVSRTSTEPSQAFSVVSRFSRTSDVSGFDIYPFPNGQIHNYLPNRTISCIGDYTDMCRDMTWGVKPVWMILQAFSWNEERGKEPDEVNPRPAEKDLRFMAWNAITHGATGIIWYGKGCKDFYSEWWREFAKVNFEMRDITRRMIDSGFTYVESLPDGVRGIAGEDFEVYVNENSVTTVALSTRSGKKLTIEPLDVAIVTDVPLGISLPPVFTPMEVVLSKDYGLGHNVNFNAKWTTHPEYKWGAKRTFFARQPFTLENLPKRAALRVVVDDIGKLFINKQLVGTARQYKIVTQFDIAKYLKPGENLFECEILNVAAPTGLAFEIIAEGTVAASSGAETLFSLDGEKWTAAFIYPTPERTWGKPLAVFIDDSVPEEE